MPRPPRCLPGRRPLARRYTSTPTAVRAGRLVVPPVRAARQGQTVRAVLVRPHRRRAALVAALAMLLTLWLHQASAANGDQTISGNPLSHELNAELFVI